MNFLWNLLPNYYQNDILRNSISRRKKMLKLKNISKDYITGDSIVHALKDVSIELPPTTNNLTDSNKTYAIDAAILFVDIRKVKYIYKDI